MLRHFKNETGISDCGCAGKKQELLLQEGQSKSCIRGGGRSNFLSVARLDGLEGHCTFSLRLFASNQRMSATRMMFTVAMSVWLASAVLAGGEQGLPSGVQVTKYAPRRASFPGCTQIAFSGKTEIVTTGDRLFYRTDSESPFRESPIKGLTDAHSVVFNPRDRLFYATDTGNHRLITFRDPTNRQLQDSVASLSGIKLKRPHDIVLDRSTGWLYSINPPAGCTRSIRTVAMCFALRRQASKQTR